MVNDRWHQSSYARGAICPKVGNGAGAIIPLTARLSRINAMVDRAAHAVVIPDPAGWHMSNWIIINEGRRE
jgi:hypothetical protein